MDGVEVFRVQDSRGEGPYVTGPYTGDWTDPETDNHNGNAHPSPQEEGLYLTAGVSRFGFTSLRNLHGWFSRTELRKLSKLGYRVNTVLANPGTIKQGRYQCMFEPLEG